MPWPRRWRQGGILRAERPERFPWFQKPKPWSDSAVSRLDAAPPPSRGTWVVTRRCVMARVVKTVARCCPMPLRGQHQGRRRDPEGCALCCACGGDSKTCHTSLLPSFLCTSLVKARSEYPHSSRAVGLSRRQYHHVLRPCAEPWPIRGEQSKGPYVASSTLKIRSGRRTWTLPTSSAPVRCILMLEGPLIGRHLFCGQPL